MLVCDRCHQPWPKHFTSVDIGKEGGSSAENANSGIYLDLCEKCSRLFKSQLDRFVNEFKNPPKQASSDDHTR